MKTGFLAGWFRSSRVSGGIIGCSQGGQGGSRIPGRSKRRGSLLEGVLDNNSICRVTPLSFSYNSCIGYAVSSLIGHSCHWSLMIEYFPHLLEHLLYVFKSHQMPYFTALHQPFPVSLLSAENVHFPTNLLPIIPPPTHTHILCSNRLQGT